jgi:hypothetical protein
MCKEHTAFHGAIHNDLIMYMFHLQNTVSVRQKVLMRRGKGGEAGTY